MKSKIKAYGRWILANSVLVYIGYRAVIVENEFSQNLFLFLIWLLLLLSIMAFIGMALKDEGEIEEMAENRTQVNRKLDIFFDLTIAGALAGFGWWVSVVAYLVHTFFIQMCREVINDKKEEL